MDFVVAGVTVPTRASAGGTIVIGDVTSNIGAGDAPPSMTGYYLSRDAVLDAGDAFLGSRAIDLLPGDASSDGATLVDIPGTTRPGCYFVIAVADDGHVAQESDETNNHSPVARIGIQSDPGVTLICAHHDFNGDGTVDILWRHSAGPVSVWLMDGATIAAEVATDRSRSRLDHSGRGRL